MYTCSNCQYRTRNLKSLCQHVNIVHRYQPNFRVRCTIGACNKEFVNYYTYRSHLQRIHTEEWRINITLSVSRTESQSAENEINTEHPSASGVSEHNIQADIFHDNNASRNDQTGEEERREEDMGDDIEEHQDDSPNEDIIRNTTAAFLLKLQAHHRIPVSVINDIVSFCEELCESLHRDIMHSMQKVVTELNIPSTTNETITETIAFENLKTCKALKQFKSDHLRINYYKNCMSLIEPVPYTMNSLHGIDSIEFQYIPITKTLQSYLKCSGIWDIVFKPRENVTSSTGTQILCSFSDGQLLLQDNGNRFSGKSNLLYVQLYIDDFEICNPLGSSKTKNKITAVYGSILNLPQKYRSSVDSIFLIALAKSTNFSAANEKGWEYFRTFLNPLLKDLQSLYEDGEDICINNDLRHFHAVALVCSGDNLGVHFSAGMTTSFNSGYVCRFCTSHSSEFSKFFTAESDVTLRTEELHAEHIAYVEASNTECRFHFGVKRESPFKMLSYYRFTEFFPADVMHDFCEGILPLTVCATLNHCIYSLHLFSLEFVNAKILSFPYGFTDKKNKPVSMTVAGIKSKGSFSGTASQKWCLFRLLPFIIGKKVNKNNEFWKMYLIMCKITDIVFSKVIPTDETYLLEEYINDFLKIYNHLLPNSMTPKLHYLIHYPRMIRWYGPIVNFSCMRFEARHSCSKNISKIMKNFRNVTHSLALRNQLWQLYALHSFRDQDMHVISNVVGLAPIRQNLPADLIEKLDEQNIDIRNGCWNIASSVTVSKNTYRNQHVYVINLRAFDVPEFLYVTHILIQQHPCNGVYIVGKQYVAEEFHQHYHAHSVNCTQKYITMFPGEEIDSEPLDMYCIEGKSYIRLRYTVYDVKNY